MSRIYKVDVCNPLEPHSVVSQALVAAISPGRAQVHVAKKFINARLATPNDVAILMGRGIKVEDGTAPEKDPPPVQEEVPPTTQGQDSSSANASPDNVMGVPA